MKPGLRRGNLKPKPRAITKEPTNTVKKTKDVPNLKSILRVMIENEITVFLRNEFRGNKNEHLAIQWRESAEEKMRQNRELLRLFRDRFEKYDDHVLFVANRTIEFLQEVSISSRHLTINDRVYDVSIEDRKRAIEAFLDLCVKKVLKYIEQGTNWKSTLRQEETDNLNRELAELLVKIVNNYLGPARK